MDERRGSGGLPDRPRGRGFGARELALAAGLSTLGSSLESGCKNESELIKETPEWSAEHVKFSLKTGDWEFFVFDQSKVSLADAKDKNFHDWLWSFLGDEEWFKKLPEVDRQTYVDGLIAATRRLNPEANLDNFASLKKQEIELPIRFLADPNPCQILSKDVGGYDRLRELAKADGFSLLPNAQHQQELYDHAYAAAQDIPPSVHFYRDVEGSEDSPARLAPDVIRRLDLFGAAFQKETGYLVSLTDFGRNPAAQAKRGSIDDSTHVTFRSFDVSNGRFLSPEKQVVTWSLFKDGKAVGPGPDAELVESLQPKVEALSQEFGIFLYRENSHWHAYAPMARQVDLHASLARYLAEGAIGEVEPPEIKEPPTGGSGGEAGSSPEKKPGLLKRWWQKIFGEEEEVEIGPVDGGEEVKISELEKRLNEVFADDYEKFRAGRFTAVETRARLLELQPAFDLVLGEAFPDKKVKFPFLSILKFPSFSQENRQVFGYLTFEELQRQTASWRTSPEESERKKWRAVSQAWTKERLIGLVWQMPPEEIERVGILYGSTIHSDKFPPFFNLKEVWGWKGRNRTDETARPYVDAVLRLPLDELDHSVDIGVWRQKQQAAIDTLRRHDQELGFHPQAMAYLTPEVMLAVIHAEFFSELDGPAFAGMSPAIFEPYNLVFGPAVNDNRCSSGPVQLIERTFVGFLDNYGKRLEAIKLAEGEMAKFILPAKNKGTKTYDPDSFARAMVGDPDSVLFFAAFSVADHTKSAFRVLFNNPDFVLVWDKASDEDRMIFVGSFAPLAINGGGGTAKKAAESLLADREPMTLREMAKDLPTHTRKKFARRGAERGYETTVYFTDRAKSE